MNGALAVARYTLVELTRRRILLVFVILGALGVAAIGIGLRVFSSSFTTGVSVQDPEKINRYLELSYVSNLIGALGFFALLVAFGIGMTVIYHDLDSGAAVAIFSKPLTRAAFTAGKLAAAITAMIAVVGVLGVEASLVMLLFGGGLQGTLWTDTAVEVANALTLLLLVMALSTWMNNIVAAVVAFIYNGVASAVVALHAAMAAGLLGNNGILKVGLDVLYWLVPHQLVSDAPRELAKVQLELFPPPPDANFDTAQAVASIPGASGAPEILWWAFIVILFSTLVYVAVRRRQV